MTTSKPQERLVSFQMQLTQTPIIINPAKDEAEKTKEKIKIEDQSDCNSSKRFFKGPKTRRIPNYRPKKTPFLKYGLQKLESSLRKSFKKPGKGNTSEKPYFENFTLKKTELLPEGFQSIREVQNMFMEEKKLKKNIDLKVAELQTEGDSVRLVKMSKDKKYIACTGIDGSITCLDFENNKVAWHLEHAHSDRVSSIFISKDSQYIAAGSHDGGIKIFDVKTGEILHDFKGAHQSDIYFCWVTSVAISSDNQYIISAGDDRSIRVARIKEVEDEEVIYVTNFHFEKYIGGIQLLAVSPDMKYIASGSQEKCIQIYDFEMQLDPTNFSEAHLDVITSVIISKDSKYLLSASRDCSIKVFDLENKVKIYHFKDAHLGPINSIALSDDNKYLISGSADKTIKVFDFQTRIQLYQYSNAHSDEVYSVDLSSDNRYITSCSGDRSIRVHQLEKKSELNYLNPENKGLEAISSLFVINNQEIVSISVNGTIMLSNIETAQGRPLANLDKLGDYSIVTSKDDKYLVVGCRGDSIKIFDFKDPNNIREIKDSATGFQKAIAISNDSKYIVAASLDHSIYAFDINSGKQVFQLNDVHEDDINALILSNDGKLIVSGSQDRSIKLFKFHKQKLCYSFPNSHSGGVKSLAISSNNRYVVSGSVNGSVKIFDVKTKVEVHHLKNVHEGQVSSVVITKNNRFLISGYRTIKIFNMDTNMEVHRYPRSLTGHVTSMTVSHDDHYLIAGFSDGTIKVYLTPFSENQKEFSFGKAPAIEIFYIFIVSSNISGFIAFPDCDETLLDHSDDPILYNNYEDFYIDPHYWTILHLYAIFEPNEILKMPPYAEFKVPFLVDRYHRTPLHYLLADKKIDYNAANILFKYIIDYLKDKRRRTFAQMQTVFDSLSNIWLFISLKLSPELVKFYLKLCYIKTPTRYGKLLPQFAGPHHKYTIAKSPIAKNKIVEKLKEKGDRQVDFKTLMINVDYYPGSDDMFAFVAHFIGIKDPEIFSLPSVDIILDYLWKETYPCIAVFGVIYLLFLTLISIHISLTKVSLPLTYPIYVLGGILIIWEVTKMVFAPQKKYIKSVWTWLHILHIGMVVSFVILDVCDKNFIFSEDVLGAIIIVYGYLKGVSYFRLFRKTANIIQIMMFSFREVARFLCLLLFGIFGFIVSFLELNRNHRLLHKILGEHTAEKFREAIYSNLELSIAQDQIFNILNTEQFFVFWANIFIVAGLFLSNIIIVSLIVSIMGDAQDQIEEKKAITDAVSRLWMIQESIILYRIFRRKGKKSKPKKGYIIYCGPQRQEQDAKDSGWEGDLNTIVRMYKKSTSKQKNELHRFKKEISEVKEDVLQMQQDMKDETEHLMTDAKVELQGARQEIEETREELKTNLEKTCYKLRFEIKRVVRNLTRDTNTLTEDIQGLKKLILDTYDQKIQAIKNIGLAKKKKSNKKK